MIFHSQETAVTNEGPLEGEDSLGPRLRDAPHPLREACGLFLATLVATMVLSPFTQEWPLRVASVINGASAFCVGMLLITNYRDSANFVASLGTRSWLGVDYSKSALARTPIIRLSGVLFILVGVVYMQRVSGPL